MKLWKLIPSEMTLVKVIVTLTLLMVASLILAPHEPRKTLAALGIVAFGAGMTLDGAARADVGAISFWLAPDL